MTKYLYLIFLFYFCLVSAAHARGVNNTTLDYFFQTVQSLQADFKQTIRNSRGKILEQSNGSLVISRPDKFILDYQAPIEQKYISNGKTIWIYDVELEQVSIKTLDESVGDSPALLLSSNINIYKHYQVDDVVLDKADGYQWVQLKAKAEEMTFERVLLAFKDNNLMQMKMYDSFGQFTELKFSNVQLNKHFSNKQFIFVPPDDVDVIGAANAR